jgi:hypothetical protein
MPSQAGLLFIEAELAWQGDHQRADGNRVHVGVIVGRLQPREADQGAGVAATELEISSTSFCAPIGVDGLAHARFPEHGHHGLLGFSADLGRAARTRRLHRDALPFALLSWPPQFASTCGFGFASRDALRPARRRGPLSIQTSLMLLSRMRSSRSFGLDDEF